MGIGSSGRDTRSRADDAVASVAVFIATGSALGIATGPALGDTADSDTFSGSGIETGTCVAGLAVVAGSAGADAIADEAVTRGRAEKS
jgi:hypothetical protein